MTITPTRATSVRERSGVASPKRAVSEPRILMVTPGLNFVVRDSVFVLIDAVSENDRAGSLKVEIAIDWSTRIVASYSMVSGYYGAIWDSTDVPEGTKHTISARVTDSAGNSKSTHTVVTVG
jgi:hypothetical protein